jgi:hypothetical protein
LPIVKITNMYSSCSFAFGHYWSSYGWNKDYYYYKKTKVCMKVPHQIARTFTTHTIGFTIKSLQMRLFKCSVNSQEATSVFLRDILLNNFMWNQIQYVWLTNATKSISTPTCVTCTCIWSLVVCTRGLIMTVVEVEGTFIDIWKGRS